MAKSTRKSTVDFEKEILPILRANCLACHNTTKAKADLNLETPQLILKGGDSGPAVVPSKSAESLLFEVATHAEDPVMPPKGNKSGAKNFTPDQLALLKLWIDQGAKGEVKGFVEINWQ
ncbi:MAG: c-type cytochrome domain-containing protein, partial [Limisphaerales bacterium]